MYRSGRRCGSHAHPLERLDNRVLTEVGHPGGEFVLDNSQLGHNLFDHVKVGNYASR